jgi:hypothetical protein
MSQTAINNQIISKLIPHLLMIYDKENTFLHFTLN